MSKIAKFAVVAASVAGLTLSPMAVAKERKTGEEKLAEMLKDRVPGKPQDCIQTYGSGNLQVIDKTALVYKRGDTIWVNTTRNPKTLDDDDYLVIKKTGGSSSQLCRLDNVTTHDRGSHMFSGVIFLDQFVPYRKADADKG